MEHNVVSCDNIGKIPSSKNNTNSKVMQKKCVKRKSASPKNRKEQNEAKQSETKYCHVAPLPSAVQGISRCFSKQCFLFISQTVSIKHVRHCKNSAQK
jgi:hypothetical protein